MATAKIGRWAGVFGGRRSFETEIARAQEIKAQFNVHNGGRSIVLDEIPGWLAPMWGSDQHWLYIRRPEGLWKTALPDTFDGDSPIRLYQKRTSPNGLVEVVGGASMGSSVFNKKGWLRGEGHSGSIDAADRDESSLPSNLGFPIEADAVGSAWGELVAQNEERLLVMGGDYFDVKPIYSLRDGWLMAKDSKNGFTVAYAIHEHPSFREALDKGKLWLCYHSPWLRRFDVKVEL